MLVLLVEGIYGVYCCDGFRWHDNMPNLMIIRSGFQVIFRLLPQNLRDYNVGITHKREL
jgi:hypothetical protein